MAGEDKILYQYTKDLKLIKTMPLEGDEIRTGIELDNGMVLLAQFDNRITVIDKDMNIVKIIQTRGQIKKFVKVYKDFLLCGSLDGYIDVF